MLTEPVCVEARAIVSPSSPPFPLNDGVITERLSGPTALPLNNAVSPAPPGPVSGRVLLLQFVFKPKSVGSPPAPVHVCVAAPARCTPHSAATAAPARTKRRADRTATLSRPRLCCRD